MMPLRRFQMHGPADVSEASRMLGEFGDDGRAYAGGTELLLAMKFDVLRYPHLVDVKGISELEGVAVKEGQLEIGAATTHRTLEYSPLVRDHLPVIAGMESKVANVRVRATGSVGGNLCFAEPHSDPATLFTILRASLVLKSGQGQREVSIDEFLVDAYETCLEPDELLTTIRIPLPGPEQRIAYTKFQVHERPTLGLALLLEVSGDGKSIQAARAAVGCVSPRPCRSAEAEKLLVGSRATVEAQLATAADHIAQEAELVDDYDGGVDYKRNLIRVYLERAYRQLMGEGD